MAEVTLLYSCDAWHTHSSKNLLGVFSSIKSLVRYLNKMQKAKVINAYEWQELISYKQTQGKSKNYMIEKKDLNPKFKT